VNRKELFEQARAAFTPDASDNPECIPFYRVWAGLKAVWGAEFCANYHYVVHQAACYASDRKVDAYEVAVATAKDFAQRIELPRKPEPCISWGITVPQEPTEDDAYSLFKTQFRTAFPGKRPNSAFGKEKWQAVRTKAVTIVRDRYAEEKAQYDAEIARRKARDGAALATWEGKVHDIETLRAAVAALDQDTDSDCHLRAQEISIGADGSAS
jgi:hypothetical protein